MKQLFVKDIKPGQSINNVPFVVLRAEKKIAKSGNEYMDVLLGDSSGSIAGKIWKEKFDACSADKLTEGVVILASGSATEFMGKTQFGVTMAIPTTEYAEEDFVPVTKKDIDTLMQIVYSHIDKVNDRHIKKLLSTIFNDASFIPLFKRTPAAMKMHHAYVGGLLEHITEMLAFAEPMCELYQPCNRDLVIAGILLHDIGKVEEIVWRNMAIEYSDKGKLLGHIQIGLEIMHRYRQADFDQECWQLLQHIILAHHGKLEYGSAVIPATIEAKVVSLADDASAKLRGYLSLYDDSVGNGASFSEYSRALETMVYMKNYVSASSEVSAPTEVKQLELI